MSTFRRHLGIAAALVCVPACAGDLDLGSESPLVERSSKPLIGGSIAHGDEAVVALTRGGEASFCSGTLISPSVILTAAHCIDMAGNDPNITIFFGSDTRNEGLRLGVAAKQQHLEWTGDLSDRHDIGLLLMTFPHPDPLIPMPLNTSPGDEHVGDSYRHVGFGVFDRETGSADGQKREGTTTITDAVDDVIISGDENLSVCFGDSGGPGFITIDEVEYVTGVHSYTTSDECYPPNGDTRVDLYVEDFILPWVADNDPVCGADGTCAPIGCIDDPDCTPCGRNGECTSECALPDPDCPTSAIGEICQADSQCMSDLCVFWQGDLDYHFCSEPCTPGEGACPEGMSCQSVNPFGNICYYDADPPGVLGDTCEEPVECGSYECAEGVCVVECDLSRGLGCPEDFECRSENDVDYYCFASDTDSGGCTVAGDGSAPAGWILLPALALAWGLVRRRRSSR